jgi:hypothetical protein
MSSFIRKGMSYGSILHLSGSEEHDAAVFRTPNVTYSAIKDYSWGIKRQ